MVGQARDGAGKAMGGRESLGHDFLVAQYRARAMSYKWFEHVQEAIALAHHEARKTLDLETIEIWSMDRAIAKTAAWEDARLSADET